MFWFMRFALKSAWRLKLIVLSALAGLGAGLYLQLRQEQRTWGVVPGDVDRALAGDDLVAVPDVEETRSLAMGAPPAAVWPWLVQIGWGRGGWYSYDQLDLESQSADTVLAEHQDLAEGDLVPTHPGGGFVARVVEPDKALVLYLDSELVEGQMETAAAESGDEFEAMSAQAAEGLPGGLQVAGALGDFAMPEFRASWALVLEEEPDGSTRLIERMRVWNGQAGLPQQLGQPLFGLGVFVMTRKHMLGVKERAERLAAEA